MKNSVVISTFILISLLTQNCSKSQGDQNVHADQINTKQLMDCYTAQNYDSTRLASQLIGNWKWIESYAYAIGSVQADKAVFLNLTQGGTYTVTVNSVISSQGHWGLQIVDGNGFGLVTTQSINYLQGRILLCGNQLLFNNSYIDGADNLFARIQ
jgi:hypothetical protein